MANESTTAYEKETLVTAHSAALWTRNFILLCVANLVLFMSTQMLIPTMPAYLFTIGGNETSVGYVMGAYTLCAMAMRPVAGWLVDNYGRRFVLIGGLIMMMGAASLYQLADNVLLTILFRGLHGLAFGLTGTAVGTVLADSLPSSRMNEGMGYFGLTSSISLAVAPLLGFALASQFGYSRMFWAVAALSGLAMLCSLPIKTHQVFQRDPEDQAEGLWASLWERTAWPASTVLFFLAIVYASVISFVSLFAAQFNIINIGPFFTALAISMFVSRPIAGRWADAGGTNLVILIGHLAILAGMLITAYAHNLGYFLISGLFIGFGYGFCFPTLQALAVYRAPAYKRGAATGTFFIAFDSGIGLGTIIWGYVALATSYQFMFFTTLIPLAAAGAIFYKNKSSSK